MTAPTRRRDTIASRLFGDDTPTAWMDRAACRPGNGVDPAVFHPNTHNRGRAPADGERRLIAAAKAVCAGCPVRRPCVEFAVATGDDWATYGGLTAAERREVRRPDHTRQPAWQHRPDLLDLIVNSRADNRLIASVAGVHPDTVSRWRREIAEEYT